MKGIKAKGGEATAVAASISDKAQLENAGRLRAQDLRQDRHHGLQRRLQSVLRPAHRAEGGGVPQDHAEQRHVEHLRMMNMVGPEMAERKDGVFIIVSSIGAPGRLGAHRGLQHEQGRRPRRW